MKKSQELLKGFASQFGSLGQLAVSFSMAHAITELTGKIKEMATAGFELGVANTALAATLGISAAKLAGMQLAADYAEVSQDDLSAALMRLEKNIGAATLGAGEMAGHFQKLGLDANTLAEMPLEEALADIADAISAVDNKYQQASLASEIFGKGGIKLMNILRGGSDELKNAAADAEKFGTAISGLAEVQFSKMDDAMDRITARTKGWGLAWAENMAPVISFFDMITDEISKTPVLPKWMTGEILVEDRVFKGVRGKPGNPAEAAGIDFGDISDDLKTVTSLMDSLQSPIEKVTLQMEALDRAFMFGEISINDYEETMKRLVDTIDSPVTTGIEKLQNEVRNLGLTVKQIDLNNALMHGANEDQLAIIGGLHDQIDAHKKLGEEMKANAKWQMKLGGDAKKVWEETQTPVEEFRNKFEELQNLFGEGFLDQETFERGLLKAQQALEDKFPMADKGTGAKLKGSQDAFSAIDQFNRRNDSSARSLQSLVQNAQRQTEIQNRLAKDVANELNNLIAIQGI